MSAADWLILVLYALLVFFVVPWFAPLIMPGLRTSPDHTITTTPRVLERYGIVGSLSDGPASVEFR
jgi:hypothetical protein